MAFGSMPNDGGNLLLSTDEKNELLSLCPAAEPYIRRLIGSEEYINNLDRWCLWLVDIEPNVLHKLPEVMKRVEKVKEKRLESTRAATKKLASTPTLFGEIRQPKSAYLAYPEVSSERREYVPIGYVSADIIATNKIYTLADATLYDFGVLISAAQMTWLRTVCGRLKSDYQFSAGIVYNNFVWPSSVSEAQKASIEKTAQGILDARALFPNASLAALYDPLTMPPELRKAHEANDKAVDAAYGYKGQNNNEERAAFLFTLYKSMTTLPTIPAKKTRKQH